MSIDTSLKQILHLLSDGQFHSDAEIGKILELPRSDVSKLIQQCSEWNIEVESITGKGYRIPGGLSLLEKSKIQQALALLPLSPQIEIFDSISSTQDYLLQLPNSSKQLNPTPMCCLAECQTQGRGRQGRSWVSPFARNIYLSLLWHFPTELSALAGLSLVCSIAVIKALESMGVNHGLGLKWPNDILWNHHQKLSGVLIELQSETHNVSRAVIGVGVNVCMPRTLDNAITQPWIDLIQILNRPCDRNQLSALLINTLMKSLTQFQSKGFASFIQHWQEYDITFGKAIILLLPTGSSLHGVGRGITEQGLLKVEMADGSIKTFASGEVSVRVGVKSLHRT